MRRRTLPLAAFLLALVLAAAACTSDGTTTIAETTDPEPSESPLPTVDVDVDFVEGEYEYENNGVVVGFSWKGGTGILTVDNGSGFELGAPSMYAVTPQQDEIAATIPDAEAIPDGGSAELEVTFPDTLDPADAGLIALVFGDQNWGALSPVIAG